jgi:hypothetical protein
LTLAAAASGKGQTVAIVDAYDDPDAESDLGVYRAQYGLPPCTTANGCFDKVNQEGEASPLPVAAGTTGWATEESLDLDMASAICPNCHILLVEADNNLLDNMGTAVDSAVALGSQFVSNSYAAPDASVDTALNAYYDHPGVAVTVAAGDSGYGVEFPAASPYVTAVGGTELIADKATARGWAEQVWGNGTSGTDGDGTGSGCSAYEAKPSWQTDTGCTNRTVADVAADADPDTGAAIYDSYDQSGWLEVGGTSEATPIIAATYALAGAPGAGDNPAEYPYEHTGQLYAVAAGSNGSCSPVYLCNGGAGYNGPTGNGTPDGTGAFRAGANTITVASPSGQSSIKGEAITPLTVTAADSDPSQALTWSATGLPAGLSINSASGVISGKPTAAATSTVTVDATDDTGATGSATFTWQVTSNTITVTSPGTQTAMTGRNVTPLTITATDSDPGQTLSYTASGLPRGLSISPSGVISGTPTELQHGHGHGHRHRRHRGVRFGEDRLACRRRGRHQVRDVIRPLRRRPQRQDRDRALRRCRLPAMADHALQQRHGDHLAGQDHRDVRHREPRPDRQRHEGHREQMRHHQLAEMEGRQRRSPHRQTLWQVPDRPRCGTQRDPARDRRLQEHIGRTLEPAVTNACLWCRGSGSENVLAVPVEVLAGRRLGVGGEQQGFPQWRAPVVLSGQRVSRGGLGQRTGDVDAQPAVHSE